MPMLTRTKLAAYLNKGGRPDSVPGFDLIVDRLAELDAQGLSDAERAELVRQYRSHATESRPTTDWSHTSLWQWHNTYLADLIEDAQTRALWDQAVAGEPLTA